jgi:hypothetical protein
LDFGCENGGLHRGTPSLGSGSRSSVPLLMMTGI